MPKRLPGAFWRLVNSVVYAWFCEVNQGRIEVWHPARNPFIKLVYHRCWHLSHHSHHCFIRTDNQGPCLWESIDAKASDKEGRAFELNIPDFYEIIFELANGIVFRLNTNYYVDTGEKDIGYAVHGDKGSLYMTSWHNYDASVSYRNYGDKTNYQAHSTHQGAFYWALRK